MSYLLLIMEKPGDRSAQSPADGEARYERMLAFGADLSARGLLVTAEALKSDATAARVWKEGGRARIVDGPFAEAKEMVGGFFLLSCRTRADAIAIAHECPAIEWATVEVRELGTCVE